MPDMHGGLSQDPQKRERQLAGLRKGWHTASAKHAPRQRPQPPAPEPAPVANDPEPGAPAAPVTVLSYSDRAADPPAAKPAARKPKRRKPPQAPRQPDPAADREPVAEKRDGFWAGVFGGPGY